MLYKIVSVKRLCMFIDNHFYSLQNNIVILQKIKTILFLETYTHVLNNTIRTWALLSVFNLCIPPNLNKSNFTLYLKKTFTFPEKMQI